MPPEYDSYVIRNGLIYRVEKSESGHSWALYVDDCSYGWDQRGDYVKTLVLSRNGDLKEAIRRAKEYLPEESAFWVEGGAEKEWRPKDEAFEKWFNSLGNKRK